MGLELLVIVAVMVLGASLMGLCPEVGSTGGSPSPAPEPPTSDEGAGGDEGGDEGEGGETSKPWYGEPVEGVPDETGNSTQIAAYIQGLEGKVGQLEQRLSELQASNKSPVGTSARASEDEYEDDVARELKELKAQQRSVLDKLERQEREQQEALGRQQAAFQINRWGTYLDQLNGKHPLTQGGEGSHQAMIAHKIKEEVMRRVDGAYQQNPYRNDITAGNVEAVWREEYNNWHALVSKMPGTRMEQAAAQVAANEEAAPEAGGGSTPTEGNVPPLSPNSDQFWDEKKKRAMLALERGAAQPRGKRYTQGNVFTG